MAGCLWKTVNGMGGDIELSAGVGANVRSWETYVD